MEKREPKYKVGQTVTYTCDVDGKQDTFKVVNIKKDCINDGDNMYTTFVYYDGEGGFLAEEDIEGIARESIDITEESLIADGWEKNIDFDEYFYYEKVINHPKKSGYVFYCTVRPFSNTVGRDWSVHVDNGVCNTVGTIDVANFGQIDKFIELLSE